MQFRSEHPQELETKPLAKEGCFSKRHFGFGKPSPYPSPDRIPRFPSHVSAGADGSFSCNDAVMSGNDQDTTSYRYCLDHSYEPRYVTSYGNPRDSLRDPTGVGTRASAGLVLLRAGTFSLLASSKAFRSRFVHDNRVLGTISDPLIYRLCRRLRACYTSVPLCVCLCLLGCFDLVFSSILV